MIMPVWSLSIYPFCPLNHASVPKSRMGRTHVVYSWRKCCELRPHSLVFSLEAIWSALEADAIFLSTWALKLSFLSKKTPSHRTTVAVKRQPPSQNPVFEITQQPHHQLTSNFRSTIFNTPSHPYKIFRPGALLLHFLLQELWLLWFLFTPVIPLSGVKPHQKSGISTTSNLFPPLPTTKTTPTGLRIFF